MITGLFFRFFGLFLLFTCFEALAYFDYDDEPRHPDGGKYICQAGLINTGVPVGITALAGMGNDIPLSKATLLLLPRDWVGHSSVGDPRVSWGGKSVEYSWLAAFNDIALDNNLCVNINWDQRVVYVDAPTGPRGSKYQNLTSLGSVTGIYGGSGGGAVKFIAKQKWVMSKGSMLSDTVKGWALKHGWSVAWTARYDYPVDYTVHILGSFEYAMGKLLDAYRYSDKALVSCFHSKNKVIEIRERRGGFDETGDDGGNPASVCG